MQYLNRPYLQEKNLFTETLQTSDSERSTCLKVSEVYFQKALLLYHIGKGWHQHFKRKKVTLIVQQISGDKNKECISPFLKIKNIAFIHYLFK